MSPESTKIEVGNLARILVLVGGVILVIFGVLQVAGLAFEFRNLGFAVSGSILGIIVGLVAVWGHRQVRELVWAVILVVLGWYVGGLGGLLVLLGGLIGLLMRFAART